MVGFATFGSLNSQNLQMANHQRGTQHQIWPRNGNPDQHWMCYSPVMTTLSRRVSTLKPSITVALNNRAKALKASGVDVLGYAAGEPDFDTPQPIKDAAIKSMLAGHTKYTPTLGDMPTRQCIADKLVNENHIPGLTGEHVAIGVGGKHVLYNAIQCLFDFPASGEDHWEMLLPTPAWVSYRPICELSGGKVKEINTGPESDFLMTPEQLQNAITPRSRLLILNSPSNPCGTMYSESQLRALAKIIHEAVDIAPELVVLTDEIYEKIVYGQHAHFSIGSIPEIADRVITLNGMSKAYAMTGWRIGYAAGPEPLIAAMRKIQSQSTSNPTSIAQAAAIAALEGDQGCVTAMREAFKERHDYVVGRLNAMPGVRCRPGEGTFYCFPDFSEAIARMDGVADDVRLAEWLLEEAGVAVVPGSAFGAPGHVRISFATGLDQLREALDRIERALPA